MLAIVYLAIMVALGECLCRRFYRCLSLPHRLAASFLVGLLLSSWATYLGALAFGRNAVRPLMWGNLFFFLLATGSILWLRRHPRKRDEQMNEETLASEQTRADKWDWVTIGVITVFTCWLMFSSFNMRAGKLEIANHQFSDFGPNVAIMQSFALGHNFPTQYTHFSGERIRYHFLFYFQAGNLEYLGLNPAWSNNVLSVLSLVSMLIMVMTLGTLLFRSRAVGRIGAALFFFHGSLAYISFIRSSGSVGSALSAARNLTNFLPSGFTYRGEDWGLWSQAVFLNQRHLASAIGILLLALILLVLRYRATLSNEGVKVNQSEQEQDNSGIDAGEPQDSWTRSLKDRLRASSDFIFCGVLLGLLPMWNSAVFVASVAVLALLTIFFPLRKQMLVLALTTAIVALPQIFYLKTGNIRSGGYSTLHWGYTLENPTVLNVLKYLGFTFGFKWLLIAVALYFATGFQRRFMLAVSSLLAVAFLFQFSDEVLANHKFLNVWLIVANLFVAYGLWRLWTLILVKSSVPSKVAVLSLFVLITLGGVIDLFPIRNSYFVEIPFEGDPLVSWVTKQTDPKAIFLTDRVGTNRILLAGRRIFYGWPYYAWSAGYLTGERDKIYKRLFEERDPQELLRLLVANNISYVAIDDGVRKGDFVQDLNEAVYEKNFEKVFADTKNQYAALSIFKVSNRLSSQPSRQGPELADVSKKAMSVPEVNAFEGGRGYGRGQFAGPRGVATDSDGNIYVGDSGNSRIQKFSPRGEFLASLGSAGNGDGELREPNGLAIDHAGDIFVADASNHNLIKLNPDGTLAAQWSGPPPSFYGPRDVAFGPDESIYVLDQGRSRVVHLNQKGESVGEWGRKGAGAGELDDPTGLAVSGERVYVADAGNSRIQVFDLEGKFIRQWLVAEWQKHVWEYPDIAFDPETQRLYATSTLTNEVLVFSSAGKRLESLTPPGGARLDGPSALVLAGTRQQKVLYVINTNGGRVSSIELQSVHAHDKQ